MNKILLLLVIRFTAFEDVLIFQLPFLLHLLQYLKQLQASIQHHMKQLQDIILWWTLFPLHLRLKVRQTKVKHKQQLMAIPNVRIFLFIPF